MKRHFIKFLLGILYIGIVATLLLIHIQMISGTSQRILASIETLLLGIWAVGILILYIRLKEKTERWKKQQSSVVEPDLMETQDIQYTFEWVEEYLLEQGLSKRESEVGWLLYRGYTNRQIGEELFIAETTVKKHVSHIYEKLQVSGRKEYREKVQVLLSTGNLCTLTQEIEKR